jgi:hypothetical protein
MKPLWLRLDQQKKMPLGGGIVFVRIVVVR